MPNELPATSYAVLGLLSWGPKSPYHLTQLAAASISYFYTISKSQIYGELRRLEELGFVSGRDVKQKTLPDKRVYRLTASGEKALRRWLSTPGVEPDRFRSAFLVKVMFGHLMPPDAFIELIGGYQKAAEKARDQLRGVLEGLEDSTGAEFARATALLGHRISTVVAKWAVDVKREFSGGKQ